MRRGMSRSYPSSLNKTNTKLSGLLKSYLLIAKGEITLDMKHLCIRVANIGRVGLHDCNALNCRNLSLELRTAKKLMDL